MSKRKRGGGPRAGPANNSAYDDVPRSKLAINNYMDVADDQDAFDSNRDKILLEDAPEMKRWRGAKGDDVIELSDEEVLAGSAGDSEDDEEYSDDDEEMEDADGSGVDDFDEEEANEDEEEEDEDDPSGWGTSKADFYGADEVQTEEDYLREEQAAREAQQKRLKGLTDADFGLDDADGWATTGDASNSRSASGNGVISEELPEIELKDGMTDEEKNQLLKIRYPEFELLGQEFVEGRALFKELEPALEDPNVPLEKALKAQALSAYLGSLVMYFAILTSTAAEDKTGNVLPMAPQELRDHGVMETILRCRQNWVNVKDSDQMQAMVDIETSDSANAGIEVDPPNSVRPPNVNGDLPKKSKSKKKKKTTTVNEEDNAHDARFAASEARRQARLKQTEESLAKLTRDITEASKEKPNQGRTSDTEKRAVTAEGGYDSDMGDEIPLDADEAAEKERKRKSLRFYTSQIQQKANKRANAARAVGGDDDIPRRERLRDRQERLLKEAEKRGMKQGKAGEELGGGSDDDAEETNLERERRLEHDSGDAEADALEAGVLAKKASKRKREEAYQQAKAEGGKVVHFDEDLVGADGRREIGYKIEKNKGLAPKRNKDVKNPRVKKRKRFEDKSKKLRSMKPVFKGGEGRGGYGGELTGIKKGLVKSVKL